MKLGLLTRNPKAYCSTQLIKALQIRSINYVCFGFSAVLARVAYQPKVEIDPTDFLEDVSAILVRPIGRGSLDEIIFRLDLLHRLENLGIKVVNSPFSIEKAVDKYFALTVLEEKGIPVPRTAVTENPGKALKAFTEFGNDVIVKPIFGSRGIGVTRISDIEVAKRIFRSLAFMRNVLYVQEFIPHGTRDIRAFVIGEHVVAAMYRISENWRTNVSQGAKAVSFKPSIEVEELAVKAAKTLGCEIAGVDIMEGTNGYIINEVNSQPGFRGLQSTTKTDIAGEIINHVLKIAK